MLASALLAGCAFRGDYAGGTYRCSDGKCPRGLLCNAAKLCVAPGDAGAGSDAARGDAHMAALTCADPGLLPAAGGTVNGSTATHANNVTGMCGGSVLNGFDAVYRIATTASADHVHVTIAGSGGFPAVAYLIAPCQAKPNVPACEGNMLATSTTAIDLTPFVGDHFVVVDAVSPTDSGAYTLTVSVGP